jgi:hypothetical protein
MTIGFCPDHKIRVRRGRFGIQDRPISRKKRYGRGDPLAGSCERSGRGFPFGVTVRPFRRSDAEATRNTLTVRVDREVDVASLVVHDKGFRFLQPRWFLSVEIGHEFTLESLPQAIEVTGHRLTD